MAFSPGPKLKAGIFFFAVAAVSVLLGWFMRPVIVPLLLASILYVGLEPLVSILQRKGLGRITAIALVLFGMLVIGGVLAAVTTPLLVDQLGVLRERLPGAWEDVSGLIAQLERTITTGIGMEESGHLVLDRLSGATATWREGAVGILSSGIARVILWAVTVPLVAFFLLKDYRSLRNMMIGLTPNRHFEGVLAIYHRVADQLQRYFRGVMMQSGLMALITATGFSLIGLPMAPVLGILAGVLNIIPYLGPVLGVVAPVLVAMTTGTGIDAYIGVVGVVLVAQLVDNIFVIPAVVARAANIHPLMALFGVIIAGSLFGLPGMVFAIPILSSTRIIYRGILSGVERRTAA